MPRDSDGDYAAPVNDWNPPVDGAVIDPNGWVVQLADYEVAFTDSLSRTGQGGMLSDIKVDDNAVSLTEIASPSSPSANDLKVYAVDDAGTTRLATKDSAGLVTILGSATSSYGTFPTTLDFAANSYSNGKFSDINDVRNSSVYEQTIAGVLSSVSANVARQTDLGMLLEGTATQLQLQSKGAFNNATYWLKTNLTVSDAAAVGPDGLTSAAIVTDNSTNGIHDLAGASGILNVVSGTTYVFSAVVKAGTQSLVQLTFSQQNSGFTGAPYVNFDLSQGIVVDTGGTYVAAGIQPLAGGYYLIWISKIANNSVASRGADLGFINSVTSTRLPTYMGSGTTVNLWSIDFVAGNYPSSHIDSTTATVVRAPDKPSLTAAQLLVLQNSPTWTMYIRLSEVQNRAYASSACTSFAAAVLGIDNSTIGLQFTASDTIECQWGGGSLATTDTLVPIAENVICLAKTKTGRKLVINGGTVVSDTASPSVPTSVYLGTLGDGTLPLNGTVKSIEVVPSDESDYVCQQKTALPTYILLDEFQNFHGNLQGPMSDGYYVWTLSGSGGTGGVLDKWERIAGVWTIIATNLVLTPAEHISAGFYKGGYIYAADIIPFTAHPGVTGRFFWYPVVYRYDATTLAYVDTFINDTGNAGVQDGEQPFYYTFGGEQPAWYVMGDTSTKLMRYDALGTFVESFNLTVGDSSDIAPNVNGFYVGYNGMGAARYNGIDYLCGIIHDGRPRRGMIIWKWAQQTRTFVEVARRYDFPFFNQGMQFEDGSTVAWIGDRTSNSSICFNRKVDLAPIFEALTP